jgi:transposase InsO family protein
MKEHGGIYPVKKMAKALNISRSRYYSWLTAQPSAHKRRDLELGEIIEGIFHDNRGAYGSPRVHRNMAKKRGIHCARKRVARLMRERGLRARQKQRFKVTTDSRHDYPISPNLVGRNFLVAKPNTVWVSDITYIDTQEGWLYLCIVLDLFSRIIAGWAMEAHMRAELVIAAVSMAVIHRNPPEKLLFHSDQGIQYASGSFREKLDEFNMIQSMSRKGDCWDNACAESFFATLKNEEVFHRRYKTREEARRSIFEYIAVFYNRQRSHSYLDFLSPEEYELRMSQAQNVA